MLVIIALGFIAHVMAETVFPRLSPQYLFAFQVPLPIPHVKEPSASYTNPQNQVPIDFYEIESRPFSRIFFPNLPGASNLLGYDGVFPGPTIRVQKGRQTVVRVVNKGQDQMNLHLHGSFSRSVFDGFAKDLISTGEYKDYYYPNTAARTLWYHDHTNGKSAVNMYKGLAGMYQIVDRALDASLGLPSGDKYDVPLIFTSHYFTANGTLSDESAARTSTYGDTILVNGQIQPYLAVEPRKYRFRFLNAANSRVFNFTLNDGASSVPLSVIGSDGGFRLSPIDTRNLIVAMADRWEVMIDFTPLVGKNISLSTKNLWSDTAYAGLDEVLRFVVGKSSEGVPIDEKATHSFHVDLKFPGDLKIAAERTIVLQSHMDMMWGLNSFHMDDAMSRIMMRPPLGTVEKYTFRSAGMGMTTGGKTGSSDPSLKTIPGPVPGGMSGMMGSNVGGGMMGGAMGEHHGAGGVKRQMMGGSGGGMMSMANVGWTHAMHLHLDMKIVSRRKQDPTKAEGRDYVEEYEQDALKDVVLLGSNEIVEVLVKFQPYPGVYMIHCHNAVHEDQGMMGIFNVTKLADLGYKDLETDLEDPMDSRFRAKKYTGTNLDEVKSKTLPFFASLNAYPDPAKVNEVEDRYWNTHAPPSGDLTGPVVKGGGKGRMS
ncbi:hypothetical protein FKW77_001322 [Venturia effusa]|uniref:Plastocyanin-like domain-containing protein n=1 Tax=Venturia effusa TaxID=50376 RepID=A0A517LGQ3_9PEZI|nr:hypothetical protein FKW77_001322 [Venturia effusa]